MTVKSFARKVFISGDGRLRSGWAVLLFFVFLAVFGLIARWVARWAGVSVEMREGGTPGIAAAMERLIVWPSATWLACLCARQPFGDAYLRDSQLGLRLANGTAWGAGLISTAVMVPLLAGQLALTSSHEPLDALLRSGGMQLLILVPGSIGEELLFRGFILQQGTRGLGRHASVSIAAVLFGLVHMGNPNVGPFAIANIILVGLLFGTVTVRSGSLWIAAGMHAGWNVFQGYVWGQPVSGISFGLSVLERSWAGSTAWTGGAFGPEASVVTSVVLAIAWGMSMFVPLRKMGTGYFSPGPVPRAVSNESAEK